MVLRTFYECEDRRMALEIAPPQICLDWYWVFGSHNIGVSQVYVGYIW